MTQPDLRGDIYDALGIGHATAGKVLQSGETFILADNFIPAHIDDSNTTHDAVFPMLLHTGSGRRFKVLVTEVESDTPPDPARIGESGQVTPSPQSYTPPEVAAMEPVPEPLPASAFSTATPTTPDPSPVEEEPVVEETIAAPIHQPQPEHPESNVDIDFMARVKEHDANLKPGAPIPPPKP